MATDDFTIYSKPDYFASLLKRISTCKKGDRIAIATMDFNADNPAVQEVVEALCQAAASGASVLLLVDSFIFLTSGKLGSIGPMWFAANAKGKQWPLYRRRLEALQRLEAAGGQYVVTNPPGKRFSKPFIGRSHMKFAVINDYVMVGGCNLTNPQLIDMMIGWRDAHTANTLYGLATGAAHRPTIRTLLHDRDQSHLIDTKTNVLIDAGRPKQSIILDQALQLIDNAQKWLVITCQFFPGGLTGKHLIAARERGVTVTVVFTHPNRHWEPGGPLGVAAQHLNVWRERTRVPRALFAHGLSSHEPFVHAKVIATEQGAIIGSHNYVQAGVLFGTAEIALARYDPAFARAAIASLQKQHTRFPAHFDKP
ncbi:MAG TPA: phospholipase D-like domain-containing protein [Nevskiaceae bacterium]|nr:phospholipase D-like domain-containing protein [Nevskiaceae bacterium]